MVDAGMDRFQRARAVLDLAIGRDVLHRAGTIQGHEGHDILDAGGLHPAQRIHHAAAFHLEHRDRAGTGEKIIAGLVVQRDGVDLVLGTLGRPIQFAAIGCDMQGPPAGIDQIDRVLDHGQRLQAQKVELDQPGLFHPFHVELRRRHVRSGIAIQGHQPVQRPVPDHHPRRVGRGVAIQPLDLFGIVQQPGDHLFAGGLAQARFFGPRPGDADGLHPFDRDHLGQAIHLHEGQLQNTADIAHRCLGQQRAEGDDLANLFLAVFLLHIADHLFAAIHAEIDVEIRHADPFGVQEAFEQEVVAQRIQIGDGQGIGNKRPRPRAAPRSHRDVVVLGPLDEIGDDQEIARKAHLLDDAQLEIQPLFVILDRHCMGDDLQPRRETFLGLPPQLGDLVIGESGQDRLVPFDRERAAAGDLDAIVQRLGQVGEQDRHFLGRLEIVLRRQAAAGLGLIDIGLFGDADQRVMGLEHFGPGEIDVVRGDQRQFLSIGKLDQSAFRHGLGLRQLAVLGRMALQFDIESGRKGRAKAIRKQCGLVGLT